MKTVNWKLKIAGVLFLLLCATPAHAAIRLGSPNTATLMSGLVGYWPLDGSLTNWRTNTTQDISGQGNTGTLIAMSTTSSAIAGEIGGALKFNGTNSYVISTSNAPISGSQARTVSFWVNQAVSGSGLGLPVMYLGAGSSNHLFLVAITSSGQIQFAGFGNDATLSTPNSVQLNKWYHIVVVYDGTTKVTGYVNGTTNGPSTISTLNTTAAQVNIGRYTLSGGWGNGGWFQGSVDDVRVYNRALSATEVQQLYTLGTANAGSSYLTHSLYVGPGDIVSGATVWYGLRAYNKAYATGTNNAINIRRASDSTTKDIKILYSGDLDVPTAKSFCDGTTCFLATWYDQSGNAKNATAVGSAQPQLIFNGIGSLPIVQFVGASSQGLSATIVSVAQQYTGSGVSKVTTNNGSQNIYGNGSFLVGYCCSVGAAEYAGGFVSATAAANVWHAAQYLFNGASSIINVDGTETTVSPGAGSTGTSIVIGGGGINSLTGFIAEAGLWPSGFTSTQRASMNTNQHNYWKFGSYTSTSGATVGHSNAIIPSGLVGYWPLDGSVTNWRTNTTQDISGNGNTGQLNSMSTTTSPVAGKIGQALKFDGVAQYSLSSTPYTTVSNWTLVAWIKPASLPQLSQAIYNGNDAGGYGFGVGDGTGGSGSKLQVLFGSVSWLDPNYTLSAGQWYHVVMTRDSATTRVYVNGAALSTTFANTPGSVVNKFTIGMQANAANVPTRFFGGTVDDVRIYNRALSQTDVQQLYNGGR